MKYYLKVIIILIFFITSKSNCVAQTSAFGKTENISNYIQINKITGIEIYDSETEKRWSLSSNSLNILSKIIKKSSVTRYILMPPTRYYIKFMGVKKFEDYETYMSSQYIYFDPGTPSTKNRHQFTIVLSKAVDWGKLR